LYNEITQNIFLSEMLRKKIIKNLILLTLVITLTGMGILYVPLSSASSPKDSYFYADNCYQKLKKSSDLQKYRHSWINCIERYEKVYTTEPHNPWASAGMYRAAQLYLDLYNISNVPQDKIEAMDLLHRIVKRYPGSAYTPRCKRETY